MSAPQTPGLTVLRGDPAPEELAALLVVLAAARRAPVEPARPPGPGHGWRPDGWHRPAATAPHPAGWRRTLTPIHGRTTR